MHIIKVLAKPLLCVLLLLAPYAAFATAFIYPASQAGYTLTSLPVALNASNPDSLTFDTGTYGSPVTVATTSGTGNISILNFDGGLHTITASGAFAIQPNHVGNLSIDSNLTIAIPNATSGNYNVINFTTAGSTQYTITNNGTVTATANGANDLFGINTNSSAAPAILNNTATGTITITDTVGSAGIAGAIIHNSNGTSTNAGVIQITAHNSFADAGVNMSNNNGGSLNNTGTISATSSNSYAIGVHATGIGATITNNGGSITATGPTFGRGVQVAATNSTVTNNNGTISGSTNSILGNSPTSSTTNVNLNGGTITGAIAQTNIITFDGGVSTTVTGNVTTNQYVVNPAATAVLNGILTSTVSFSNSGTAIMQQTFTQGNVGTFTNSGILAFDTNTAAISGNLTGGGVGTVAFGQNTPTTNFSLTSTISGFPNININSGSTVTIGSSGVISGTTTLTMTGNLTNNDSFSMGSGITVAGAGTLTNSPSKTLTLAGANFTGAATITNNGTLAFTANTIATNASFNTTGAGSNVTTSGHLTLAATNYTNSGTQTFTITNASTYDQLSCNCPVNLGSAKVVISSPFSSKGTFTFPVLISTNLTAPLSSNVTLPPSTVLEVWSYSTAGNTFTVNLTQHTFAFIADTPLNAEIGAVLDVMYANPTNSGQVALTNAFAASANNAVVNYNLQQMCPNINAANSTIAVQNNLFDKIDTRVIGRREELDPEESGIASGDISANSSFWIGGFGAIAKQKARGLNDGYRAIGGGAILGIDTLLCDDNLLGIAGGVSSVNVKQILNPTFATRITGYHGLLYGNQNYLGNAFLEWILSGTFNSNHSSRPISLNGNNFGVTANYHGWQAAGKFAVGKYIDITDILRITELNTLEYTFLHDPSYTESGSVAALHVQNNINRSILTGGAGVRIALLCDDPWLSGMPEIHGFVTYDALNAKNVTSANFVVGSNAFTITDNPPRLAFIVGANFALTFNEQMQVQVLYNYEYRSGYYDNSAELKIRWLF